MNRFLAGIETVLFDYGNTLIEFGPDQVKRCDRALSAALTEMFGPHDLEMLSDIQHQERRSPYSGEFLENDLAETTGALVEQLFGVQPDQEQLQLLLQVRFEAMTGCVEVQSEVEGILEKLAGRYRLGLISNYPDSHAIRHSLERNGLDHWFEVIVVSADVGRVKPHPWIFEKALQEMNVQPTAALYVGDNWLGDIQGARRAGLRAIWIRQFVPYEDFSRQPGDHPADAEISHLSELLELCEVT